ncbi:uncharacterized protein BJ212DRAFT_1267596 [Suillus subaureus]|uniref:Uncharacterized protein n=1 Tax=Suillus subaureus TaxID=48587 RepID=A0A9P7JFQ1_9AGAM|nr:uncharacterized protein BJ212DRAFT_1267596 [Suillus subaureus]KAG1819863.1 hypothetical protein BJ212DRAFT_1267596 [Suillus subaureus]
MPSPIGNSRSEPLHNANSSTWAAHNPMHSVICVWTPPFQLSDAQKASRKIKHNQKVETTKCIHDTVAIYLDEQKMKIRSLSHALDVTPKYINDIIGSHTKYCMTCKVQLTNALIHAKAKEMNTDQPVGSQYTLVELRKMVANDPQMKKLTRDEKAGYIAALTEHCKQNVTNVQGNNMAAARDVLLTTERVVKELDDLCVRTGTYVTMFVVHGHINDTIQSSMHGTDNSNDFWEDIYDIPMADYLRQYEQWACTQNQSELLMFSHSFFAVTGKKNIAMNYNNYQTAVVETCAIQLIGWPGSIKFINPSNIGTIGDIHKLHDVLKDKTCYWTALTPTEVKAYMAELDVCCSAGNIVHQPHKRCSDAGGSHKRKALPTTRREKNRPSKKAKKMATGNGEAPKSVEFVVSSDEEEEEFEDM